MKVKVEIVVEMEAKQFAALVRALEPSQYVTPKFSDGQQSIEANTALQALVTAIRHDLERGGR